MQLDRSGRLVKKSPNLTLSDSKPASSAEGCRQDIHNTGEGKDSCHLSIAWLSALSRSPTGLGWNTSRSAHVSLMVMRLAGCMPAMPAWNHSSTCARIMWFLDALRSQFSPNGREPARGSPAWAP